jgi:hypothetical protein
MLKQKKSNSFARVDQTGDYKKYAWIFYFTTVVCWLVDMQKFTSWKMLKQKNIIAVNRVDKTGDLKKYG